MTTRKAAPGRCPKCRKHVLRGLDRDTWRGTQWPVVVDAYPITELGEAMALIRNRRTHDLDSAGRLHHREAYHIRHPRRHPVHALHVCEQLLPRAVPGDPGMPPKPPKPGQLDLPPY